MPPDSPFSPPPPHPARTALTTLAALARSPRHVIALACAAVGALLALYPPAALPQEAARPVGLAVGAIGLWVTAAIPEYLTALLFFLLAVLLRAAPAATVFSGFHSATFWLVFGGMCMGAAMQHTGLGARIARGLLARTGTGYTSLVCGLVAVGVLLSFVMPSSMGRIALLIPLAVSLAGAAGHGPGSAQRTGIVLAALFGALQPAFAILPANVPNMILAGSAESLFGHTLTYGRYLLLHFPVLGLLKAVVIAVLVLRWYPARTAGQTDRLAEGMVPADRTTDADHAATAGSPTTPASPAELRLMVVLAVSVGLWATDALHHVSPAWVSLGAAVLCLWPPLGLTGKQAISRDMSLAPLLFVAGIMGLGAMVATSGAGNLLVRALLDGLPLVPGESVRNFAVLTVYAMVTGLLTTLPGIPAVLTPLATDLAAASGFSLETVLMTQIVAVSSMFLPYQSPPLVVAMQLGSISSGHMTRTCLLLAAINIVVLLPLDYLWWRWLGMF
ncbi:SLC13 family permease [Nitratidesulfovibrio sp. SRB-5]|uniref:SLC13 family permease n=1 Tax=Nitratidesulfovibrio sp. SRB-5 TaxID=2872636 RepID=UPI001026AC74|nr:SLC13 family permease [Nitratidesulfovibrio sp. SRB-5]MBZ2172289.1 anion permease [Nitratidesulfovibrio sp. SRB-5]RXF77148.1 sodium:sulfate symporter [Desulfovibrio sp. DS-1]